MFPEFSCPSLKQEALLASCSSTWGSAMPCFLTGWTRGRDLPVPSRSFIPFPFRSSPAAAPKLSTTTSLRWNSSSRRGPASSWCNGTCTFPKRALQMWSWKKFTTTYYTDSWPHFLVFQRENSLCHAPSLTNLLVTAFEYLQTLYLALPFCLLNTRVPA